jgi:hypothetical protein
LPRGFWPGRIILTLANVSSQGGTSPSGIPKAIGVAGEQFHLLNNVSNHAGLRWRKATKAATDSDSRMASNPGL